MISVLQMNLLMLLLPVLSAYAATGKGSEPVKVAVFKKQARNERGLEHPYLLPLLDSVVVQAILSTWKKRCRYWSYLLKLSNKIVKFIW